MRADVDTHDALARLLSYPRETFGADTDEALRLLKTSCPEAAATLQPFADYVHAEHLHQLEEHFTRSFDNSAERALEVGWHTFGENYTRGTFMVRMRQRLREVGVEENGELPDHLSHILPLLGRADELWAGDLAHDTVAPAVQKILDALTEQQNPWAPVLAALLQLLDMHAQSPKPPVGASVPSSWPPTPQNQPPPQPHVGSCPPLDGEEPCHE
ncbi:MAG: hypothetical protein DRQ55_03390 [Planctomycetota bacterium]|nr:MAG: hypothetical protein DRQ55_03390 [Planctomycetota bacterium]